MHMDVVLVLFAASALLEVLLSAGQALWRSRTLLAWCSLPLQAFYLGMLVGFRPNVFSMFIALLGLYRIFGLVRVIDGRTQEQYLRAANRRTTWVLLGSQGATLALWLAWDAWHNTGHWTWGVVAGVQLAVSLLLLGSTVRRLRRTAWPPAKRLHMADSDLPTISVAIPARNETEDLEACLQSLIASDYPKLEIVVLDDCSQTKRTPEIIRGFAHDGVRFVQGEEPSEAWLPKNQAYDKLLAECSGEYVLFCGVDVRFAPDSLRQLVAVLVRRKKEMLCVLPWRLDGHGTALAQAMRYWWELVPPRRLFRRPSVLSTCWIVRQELLKKSGGFAAVARSIVPEAHFARQALAGDRYSFMRASAASGIQSVKPAAEQRATAVRMRYPQMHRRPENVAIGAFLELAFLVFPFILALSGWAYSAGVAAEVLAALASLALVITFELMGRATRTTGRLFGLVALPLGVLYDVALLHYSMYRYEFTAVEWKGRNICVPAMHVIPYLPNIG
jgi:glycosyl transferase family 2